MNQRASKHQIANQYTLEQQIQLSRTAIRSWPRWILEASGLLDEFAQPARVLRSRKAAKRV